MNGKYEKPFYDPELFHARIFKLGEPRVSIATSPMYPAVDVFTKDDLISPMPPVPHYFQRRLNQEEK